MLAVAPVIRGGTRQHLALLGDSIFDNGRYVGGRPDVIAQVRSHLPQDWDATLHAVDGATTRDIPAQLAACLQTKLPLVICMIYNGNFPHPAYRQRVAFALSGFNDAIIRTAIDHRLRVLDLRLVYRLPKDYANAIEPSSVGGDKIARAIVHAVGQIEPRQPGALLLGR